MKEYPRRAHELMSRPLISVVTPFYNTASYLAECIESVLAQTYSDFEYVLVDNCSSDGSTAIAESYAQIDSRIRFIRHAEFVPQLRNYNRALAQISPASQYCKIVQADDRIFPECLELMFKTFEQSSSIGLVSSYCQVGEILEGLRYPFQSEIISGRESARWYLRSGYNIFGSQTTVMYRSSLIRRQQQFFDESLPHADLDTCLQILRGWDFGFIRKSLSFVRRDNESINSALITFNTSSLTRYVTLKRYAPDFFQASEAAALIATGKQTYYHTLAKAAVRFRKRNFWEYHKRGLSTVGETFDRPYLALQIFMVVLWIMTHPRKSMMLTLFARHHRTILRARSQGEQLAAGYYGEGSQPVDK